MKKVLKVLVILLLVLGVILGTVFLFVEKVDDSNTAISISQMISSKESTDANLKLITTYVNEDGTDNRFDLISNTNLKLNEVTNALTTYYIKTNTEVTNKKIYNQYNSLMRSESLLDKMISEYTVKIESSQFDRHLGANQLYMQSCDYLLKYAHLVELINKDIDADKISDVKFNMIELYTNIISLTFSDANINQNKNTVTTLKSFDNLEYMNSILKIRNSNFVVISNENTSFESVKLLNSKNNNLFNKYYQECNKLDFATNLVSNISLATSAYQPTTERMATYYFKLIYGI